VSFFINSKLIPVFPKECGLENKIFGFDGYVNSCHSRESGNPVTCKYLKQWIPAFAGMTNIGIIKTIYWFISFNSAKQ
jgi:hypothetical protein